MEDSVIECPARSPNTLDDIHDEDKPRVKTIEGITPELQNKISSIPVDNKDETDENIENPDDSNVVKNQSENHNKEEIVVEDSKGPDNISTTITTTEIEMTKTSKSRVSFKKETAKTSSDDKKTGGKSAAVKNTARKVLAEKQIQSILMCNSPGIFLRSKRKREADLLERNLVNCSNATTSNDNKDDVVSKNKIDSKNGVQSIDQVNCNLVKDNLPKELEENTSPLNLENEKQDPAKTRPKKTIPSANLSLMEKIIIREHEILENIRNKDDGVLNNAEKIMGAGNTDLIKNDTAPKKKYHRRKCNEPFKNERIQTRQSRSITLMQNKNEYKYFPQDPKTVKCIPFEPEDELKEESKDCTIICTPDINSNDRVMEVSSDENQNPTIGSVDKENKQQLGCKKGRRASIVAKNNSADKIPLDDQNYPKCTSTDSRISLKATGSPIAIAEHPESSRKRGQENVDENPKRKLRHVNAAAMPVYTSRIAVTKNENNSKSVVENSLTLSQSTDQGDKPSDTDCDQAVKRAKSPAVVEKEIQHYINSMSLRSRRDKTMDSKSPYLSNTDSEDTLSNVESIPNSPAQDTWPKFGGKNLKLGYKRMKLNSGQSSLSKREERSIVNKVSSDVHLENTENYRNTELRSGRKPKFWQTQVHTTSNRSISSGESGLRYYVETSAKQNSSSLFDVLAKNKAEDCVDHDELEEQREIPWLRHYERPHRKTTASTATNSTDQNQNLYHRQNENVEMAKKTSYTAGNSPSDNLRVAGGLTLRTRSGRLPPQPVTNPPLAKRGRPRKQDAQKSEINSNEKKRNGPHESRIPLNGSGLTKSELERLFFKFLQDGHFRVVPGQPPIIIHNDDLYQSYSARRQCYDPMKYCSSADNVETNSNVEGKMFSNSQHHFSAHNDDPRFCTSNISSSSELGHRLRTTNPNSQNYSNEFFSQTTYSRNLIPCSTHANTHSINTSGFNTNSPSNYAQSGYSTPLDYHQNSYHSGNVMGNNSYSDSYSGNNNMNPNGFMNNTNTGVTATNLPSTTNNFEDDFNFILNTQNQHENSTSCREMDLTMNNGNTASSDSLSAMQNSPTNNVNPDWNLNSSNQHLNSSDGLLMDLKSIDNGNELSQTIGGSPHFNNVMNNSNSTMNPPNPWMHRPNNMMNPRLPVISPWHTSLPMYNSYLNNGNAYYNNMFHPYTAFMGFDLPNGYMDAKNNVGMNEHPWMQNTVHSDGHQSTFNSTNTEFSNVNPASMRENTSNQGMNLSVSSETITAETISMKPDSTDLDMGNGNGSNHIQQLNKNTFEQVKADNNQDMQESYSEESCSPYSLGYGNDTRNLDFNDVGMSNIDDNSVDDRHQQNLSHIQDYINQRSDNLGSCVNQSYGQTGPPSCDIITDLPLDRQTEMSKLRQELVDFTRQYSEDQLSPTSQIPEDDEIFI